MIRLRLGQTEHLAGWGAFAALLAMAGLPIYIHAPKFYVDTYGVGLGTLGVVLFVLRLVDFVQDPALGWLSAVTARYRALTVALAAGLMAGSMLGLFAVTPPIDPVWWFALMLTGLFSAFSYLTITFYAQGVARAEALGTDGHIRLAAWRETGALLGVCAAAVAPTLLALGPNPPFQAFALLFAAFALGVVWMMRGAWDVPARAHAAPVPAAAAAGFGLVLRDPVARRLLIVALLNAAPVAVSSTLFLFYVESRLGAPGWEGPLLVLFFLSAAAAAPLWARIARTQGTKRTLLTGMALSIAAFAFSAVLGPGDVGFFALVCLASGAALGADLTLLSALFARRMAAIHPGAAEGFALWTFATKAALALAAVLVLPFLESQGFTGPDSPPQALLILGLTYALVPCALKLAAIALLAATPLERDPVHA